MFFFHGKRNINVVREKDLLSNDIPRQYCIHDRVLFLNLGYDFKQHGSVGNLIPGTERHETSRVCFNAYEGGIDATCHVNKFTDGTSHARVFCFFHDKPVKNCVLFRMVAVHLLENRAVIANESLE